MASTEDRLRKLVSENLEANGEPLPEPVDFDTSLSDAGVSSMDVVAFGKVVASEFNISLTAEDCARLNTLSALAAFIDQQAA